MCQKVNWFNLKTRLGNRNNKNNVQLYHLSPFSLFFFSNQNFGVVHGLSNNTKQSLFPKSPLYFHISEVGEVPNSNSAICRTSFTVYIHTVWPKLRDAPCRVLPSYQLALSRLPGVKLQNTTHSFPRSDSNENKRENCFYHWVPELFIFSDSRVLKA